MRLYIIYRDESDHARPVRDYLRDFKRQTGQDLEAVNPDTPEGSELCRLYDIVEYPTVLAVSSDGTLQNMWRGPALPTISEVSYYL